MNNFCEVLGYKDLCEINCLIKNIHEEKKLCNLRIFCEEFAENLRKNLKTGLRNAQIIITCNLQKSKVSCAPQIPQIDFIR